MTSKPVFVLDTNVLSGAQAAGWIDALSSWTKDATLIASERVWTGEFLQNHPEVPESPEWLDVTAANLDELEVRAQGQLSVQDWSCVAVTEARDGRLVTYDSALYGRIENRGGDAVWGTKFLKRTFERCGISEDAFEAGVETYISDAYLPDSVGSTLRNAEKDD